MKEQKIAIFFDCENVHSKYTEEIFNELAKTGEVIIRKAVNDWSNDTLQGWNNDILEQYAIEAVQVFRSNSKNTTDLRIVREVMEILNSPIINTVVIVSSDSDFRDLAMTIKSKGVIAIGFGEGSKTPDRLKDTYSVFFELPIHKKDDNKKEKAINLLKDAIENNKCDDGYTLVSQIGSYLNNKNSTYNAKNFGAKTWGDFIKNSHEFFDIAYKGKKNSTMIVKIKK